MKAFVSLACAAACVLLALFLFRPTSLEPQGLVDRDVTNLETTPRVAEELDATAVPASVRDVVAPQASEVAVDAAAIASSGGDSNGADSNIDVRVEVVDLGGRLLAPQSGAIQIEFYDGQRWWLEELHVDRGSLSIAKSDEAVSIAPCSMRIPTGVASAGVIDVVPLEPGLTLRLTLTAALELRVVSREFGHDLKGVEVWTSNSGTETVRRSRLQSTEKLLLEGAVSPVRLPLSNAPETSPVDVSLRTSTVALVVGAEGHAPKRIEIRFPQREPDFVALDATGSVRVEVEGEEPNDSTWLIAAEGATRNLRFQSRRGVELPYTIEQLPVGDTWIAIGRGKERNFSSADASTKVTVLPGEVVAATLEWTAPTALPRVEFAGTLLLPNAWEQSPKNLVLERLEPCPDGGPSELHAALEALPNSPPDQRAFAFNAPELHPGRYAAGVPGIDWHSEVEVPAEDTSGFRIDVPPPLEVELKFRDGMSGVAVTPSMLLARSGPIFGSTLTFDGFRLRPLDASQAKVRLALGPGTLVAGFAPESGYGNFYNFDLIVDSSTTHLEFDVFPQAQLELEFVSDATRADSSERVNVRLLNDEGDHVAGTTRSLSEIATLHLPDGGQHSVHVLVPDKFENVPVFEIDCSNHVDVHRVIELVRRR